MASTGAGHRLSTNEVREAEEGRASPTLTAQASQGQETLTQESKESTQPSPLVTTTDNDQLAASRKTMKAENSIFVRPHRLDEERKKLLIDGLQEFNPSGASVLLICWGHSSHCHIVPALIQDDWGPTDEWKEARRVWDRTKRSWKSWLPWYGVKGVRAVEITIAGRSPQKLDTFLGIYRQHPLDEKAATLQSLKQEYMIEDFWCTFDVPTGRWNHEMQCATQADDFPASYFCPYEKHHRNWVDLRRLRRRPFLKMMFCNPDLAELDEPMDDNGLQLLIPHRQLLECISARHCPTVGDLSFPGLLIQESWLLANPWMMLSSLAGMTLAISVTLAWLIYGDWAVAWNVGACFLTLCTAVCTGIYQAAEQKVS